MSRARSARRSAPVSATSSRSRTGRRRAGPPPSRSPRRRGAAGAPRRRNSSQAPRARRVEDALPEGEPGIPEEPTAEHPAAAPGYDEDPWLDDEPDEVPAEEALEQRRAPPRPTGEEDVLEETPEFLQETPEHDRLWFEQKPPRDFDWDK